MLKLHWFSSAKIISIFALTLFLGLYSGGFFKRYVFKFAIFESFSESEAKALTGKRVIDICSRIKSTAERSGTVIGYNGSHFGEMRVNIKWDKSEFLYEGNPKSYFTKCIKEVE